MTIEIFFDDLTEAKQKEILDTLGDNGNYDVFPIASFEVEPNNSEGSIPRPPSGG